MASKSKSTLDPNTSKHHCGCDQNNLHLHVEIENLKQRLLERERHIVKMETHFLSEADKFPNGEYAALTEELLTWQDKYSRLFEAHKRVQRVNQGLEDKLLKMVDRGETEKNNLQEDVATLTKKLIEQQTLVSKLHEENERYRNDLNIAIQLLQCKPSNFVPQRFDTLPLELQAKVRSYVASKQRKFIDGPNSQKPDIKTIKVPIPTFPPTAMVYSLDTDKEQLNVNGGDNNTGNGNNNCNNGVIGERMCCDESTPVDIVSAAIMAKVLKEREKERSNRKHCQTCSCAIILYDSKSCQTDENFFVELNCANDEHITSDNLNNNFSLLDEATKETSFEEVRENTNTGYEATVQPTNFADTKTASQDLIDLNGYNSDDNYEYFRNLNLRSKTKRAEENSNNANRDLISFADTSAPSTPSSETARPGPRLCSVRVQPGSNNILLDNAAFFSSPILYRRRANVGDLSESEPIVHLGKSRAPSVSSVSSDHGERKVLTETEI